VPHVIEIPRISQLSSASISYLSNIFFFRVLSFLSFILIELSLLLTNH